MFCPQCGSNIGDNVSFCPQCGAQLGAPVKQDAPSGAVPSADPGTTRSTAVPTGTGTTFTTSTSSTSNMKAPEPPVASAQEPEADTFAAQVSRAQTRSKRRLPMILIVILITLTLAATAFAATYIYQNIILPQLEEQAQQDAEADLAAQQEAEAEAQEAAEAEQRAVYDDLLTTYRDSQAQGWANASSSTLNDLASLGVIVDLREDMNVSVTYDELTSGTVSYAYADLGNDGTLDLVIGVLIGSGDEYKLIGAFSTDGSATTSLMNGSLLMRVTWDVTRDGYLRALGSDGADSASVQLYTVENGTAVSAQHLSRIGTSYYSYNDDGSTSPTDSDTFNTAADAAQTSFDLDWMPLEDFSPSSE